MMAEYLAEVRIMEKLFDEFEVLYVPHLNNCDADHLACIASSKVPTSPDVIAEVLSRPSVKPEELTSKAEPKWMIIDEPTQQPTYDWMSLMRAYLDNLPPSDNNAEV
jgi:hypothetical protein